MATLARPLTNSVKPRRGLNVGKLLLYGVCVIAGFAIGFPLYIMVSEAFMTDSEITRWPPILLTASPTLVNFQHMLEQQDVMMPRWFLNSLIVSTSVTIVVLIITSMAAFAFARLRFPGRNILFFFMLATIVIPIHVTLIPNYLLLRDLHFTDSYNGLIWPIVANVLGVFLLRQFFMSIPRELEEAAILDGASYWGVYWRIIMPLSGAALTALGIFVFLSTYNDIFWPLIVTTRIDMRTLPVGLSTLQSSYGSQRALIMAAATFATVPIMGLFIVFQRRIIKGITLTGMGGR